MASNYKNCVPFTALAGSLGTSGFNSCRKIISLWSPFSLFELPLLHRELLEASHKQRTYALRAIIAMIHVVGCVLYDSSVYSRKGSVRQFSAKGVKAVEIQVLLCLRSPSLPILKFADDDHNALWQPAGRPDGRPYLGRGWGAGNGDNLFQHPVSRTAKIRRCRRRSGQ